MTVTVPIEEIDPSHPLWEAANLLINDLAPLTRREDWWLTEGPRTLIFRALLADRAKEKAK